MLKLEDKKRTDFRCHIHKVSPARQANKQINKQYCGGLNICPQIL